MNDRRDLVYLLCSCFEARMRFEAASQFRSTLKHEHPELSTMIDQLGADSTRLEDQLLVAYGAESLRAMRDSVVFITQSQRLLR